MLVLFDIDGTLLKTRGAGMRAMLAAASALHMGASFSFDGIDISGRLDTLIWRDLLAKGGVDPTASDHASFRALYGEHLRREFDSTSRSEALAGAQSLVVALHANDRVALGLLTGNYEHTGRLKVARAGFDPTHFHFNAWADDGASRRDLPPVAMERYGRSRGARVDPASVIIIGDTPSDIDCAHANGCRAIAVATGVHPRDELASHAPELLVDDLSETEAIAQWITETEG